MAVITVESNDTRIRLRELLDNAVKQDAIIVRYKTPLAALISYDAYLAIRPALDEWRRQQALATLGELPAP